jgi:hypothetical protein
LSCKTFIVSDIDGDLDFCWYNINGGENIFLINCLNSTFNVSGDGDYSLNIYVNDSLGEQSFDDVNFSVQVGAPTITLFFPIDEYLNYKENVFFNYTPLDIDLDSCELWGNFDGSFGIILINDSPISGEMNFFSLDLEEGNYLWNIKCNDTYGMQAFNENKTFVIDMKSPIINLIEPEGEKDSRLITLRWSILDDNIDSCWYNVYRGENIEIPNSSVNCDSLTSAFNVTVDANFVLNFYANDSAGNYNSSSINFNVDTYNSPSNSQSSSNSGSSSSGSFSSSSNSPIISGINKLEIESPIGIIFSSYNSRESSLMIRNAGTNFLNNCKLKVEEQFLLWILNKENSKNLSPGEKYAFPFEILIPNNTLEGKYEIPLTISCDEISKTENLSIEIIEKKFDFKFLEVIRDREDRINLSYSIKGIGETLKEIQLTFVLLDSNNKKISEVKDSIKLTNNFETLSFIFIPINKSIEGEMKLLVNIDSENYSSFVQENVLINKFSRISGLSIFGDGGVIGNVIYFSILFLFGVFAFFIIKRTLKSRKKNLKNKNIP